MAKGDYLGEFEQLVLLALLRLGPDAYGMPVRREIEQRTGRPVAIGAVYATLERMEAKGWVRSVWSEGGDERGGRAKRVFALTGEGAESLRRADESLRSMREGIDLSGLEEKA
jgi:PadR family transcriptional regulator, regulatory protein PadR